MNAKQQWILYMLKSSRQRVLHLALHCLPLLLVISSGCSVPVDTVVFNAKIWTGDSTQPVASCFVIRDGLFIYVGNDKAAAFRVVGNNKATQLDAQNARVIPGLIDSHLHLISGGMQLSRIQLRDVPDRAAFVAAVADRAKKTPKGQWILGGRWSIESWTDRAQPSKEWIDAFTHDNPVLLSRMDGHGALANSVAMRLAGIDKAGPPDPVGGKIERDPETHEPTGILKDTAIDLVDKIVPTPSGVELDNALIDAMHEANRYGITCVHSMSPWRDMAELDPWGHCKMLTLRARIFIQEDDPLLFLERAKQHRNDDWVAIRGFKQYADGSLGSRTAYMAQPYLSGPGDDPQNRGLGRDAIKRDGALRGMSSVVARQGFAIATHAIGDQANHLVLDAYESANIKPTSTSSPRFRIEHAQHLLRDDISRFAKLGVVASMQPLHKADDGRYAESYIGKERCKTSYAFRSLLDAGAHLAFGSDWPVVSLNPFLGIHSAVTGKTLDGKTFVPEQNITVEEALRAYTSGAAYAAGDETRLGSIQVGYLADFVILQDDPFTAAPDDLGKIGVDRTFVAGRQVWPRDLHTSKSH